MLISGGSQVSCGLSPCQADAETLEPLQVSFGPHRELFNGPSDFGELLGGS
jgi:hypothetical protein